MTSRVKCIQDRKFAFLTQVTRPDYRSLPTTTESSPTHQRSTVDDDVEENHHIQSTIRRIYSNPGTAPIATPEDEEFCLDDEEEHDVKSEPILVMSESLKTIKADAENEEEAEKAENLAPEAGNAENLAPEAERSGKSAAEDEKSSKSAPEPPEAQKCALEPSEASKSAPEPPEAQKSAPESIQAQKSAPESSEASKPAPEDLKTQKSAPEVKKSSKSASEVEKSSKSAPESGKSEKSAPEHSEAQKSAPGSSEAQKTTPRASQAEISAPGASQAEISAPGASQAEISAPGPPEAQNSAPELKKPSKLSLEASEIAENPSPLEEEIRKMTESFGLPNQAVLETLDEDTIDETEDEEEQEDNELITKLDREMVFGAWNENSSKPTSLSLLSYCCSKTSRKSEEDEAGSSKNLLENENLDEEDSENSEILSQKTPCSSDEAVLQQSLLQLQKQLRKSDVKCSRLEKICQFQQKDIDSLRFEMDWKDKRIEYLQKTLEEMELKSKKPDN